MQLRCCGRRRYVWGFKTWRRGIRHDERLYSTPLICNVYVPLRDRRLEAASKGVSRALSLLSTKLCDHA